MKIPVIHTASATDEGTGEAVQWWIGDSGLVIKHGETTTWLNRAEVDLITALALSH